MDQADDRVVCVERMLAIGAAAMLSAGLQLDMAVVERRFDDLNVGSTRRSRGRSSRSVGSSTARTARSPARSEEVKEEIAAVITSRSTDEDHQRGGPADELVDQAQDKMVGEMQRQLSPDVDGSMLNRTVRDINTCVKTRRRGARSRCGTSRTSSRTPRAPPAQAQKGTQKGVAFEDVLQPLIGRLARLRRHERAEQHRQGCGGRKAGDFTITLNPPASGGVQACFVIEAKDSPQPVEAGGGRRAADRHGQP